VSGKEERAGAHQNGVPTKRRCKRRRAAAFNGSGVAPVVVDECGGVCSSSETSGVSRRRLIEERSSSKGAHRKGADGGDAQTESGMEEGLW
jgi:hypothetical protein